jgi:hypothetical protein
MRISMFVHRRLRCGQTNAKLIMDVAELFEEGVVEAQRGVISSGAILAHIL